MARKQRANYYVMFVNLQNYSRQAAGYLQLVLHDFNPDPDVLRRKMDELHAIEHEADGKKHELMQVLARDFITPIEREDIIQISQRLDDATDAIEEVLRKIYMYDIKEVRPEAIQFLDIVEEQSKIVADILSEFHDFKASTTIYTNIIEVNRLEEEADTLYVRAVRRLFEEETDMHEVVGWNAIFDQLEACCDANEDVVNTVESAMMKNS